MRRGLTAGQSRPLRFQELFRHAGGRFRGIIHDHGEKKRPVFGQQVRALDRQFPFEPEVTLSPFFALAGDDRHEQRAFLDLAADFLVPDVAAAQFAHVEPDLDAKGPQGVGNMTGRLGILTGIAEKYRLGG